MNVKVLVVEDDTIIGDFVQVVLEKQQYTAIRAMSAMEAVSLFQQQDPDLVLLDLGLPDMDGIEVLKLLRKQSLVPVIIISARDDEAGKVAALDEGADDYVTKPFGTSELLARMRTALRHSQKNQRQETVVRNKELVIDFEKHSVEKRGLEIHLTKNEFLLLKALCQNMGKVVTYRQLMHALYGPFAAGDPQVLRVNMSNIRKKLEDDPVDPQYIITEIGIGYRVKD